MNLVFFRSVSRSQEEAAPDAYTQTFDTRYADRVIGNLRNEKRFCTACQDECIACRLKGAGRFGENIVGVIDFPAVLPYVIEKPGEFVPREAPRHDVLIAISIHEQILLESLKVCSSWGTRGVIVPIESQDWVSHSGVAEAERIARRAGIEISFPKPFCSFNPPKGGFLASVRDRFHIGFPSVECRVKDGVIEEARVRVSAPCGATYYIARWLAGRRLDDDLRHDVISRRLHSYPCTASMEWDDDLGDTILHVAGQAHYAILDQFGRPSERDRKDDAQVLSPVGVMVQKPIPVSENARSVAEAREGILARLESRQSLAMSEVRQGPSNAAALNTALVILKQEGRIRIERGRVLRT